MLIVKSELFEIIIAIQSNAFNWVKGSTVILIPSKYIEWLREFDNTTKISTLVKITKTSLLLIQEIDLNALF